MKNFLVKYKAFIIITLIPVFLITLGLYVYLSALPALVSNTSVQNKIQRLIKGKTGLEFSVNNPVLKTGLTPDISFQTDNILLADNEGILFNVKDLNIVISLKKIFKKNIVIKQLGAQEVFADINKLSSLTSTDGEKSQQTFDWYFDFFDSLLYLKNSKIVYKPKKDTLLTLNADKIRIDNTQKDLRYVHFDIDTVIKKQKDTVKISISDKNKVYIKNHKIFVDDCDLNVNKSKIYLIADADKKNNFNLEIYSKHIDIADLIKLINSNIIENNISQSLVFFKDITGSFNFNIKMSNNDLKGLVNLNKASFKVIPVSNIPVTLNKGKITLYSDKIILDNFEGYYNNKKFNSLTFEGTVKDYLKSVDTDIVGRATVTNDFAKNYFSKMLGCPVTLTGGDTRTKITLKSINNKIDLVWLFGLKSGQDILIDNNSFSPKNYRRMLKADMHFEDMLLNIKSIDYYIAPDAKPGKRIKRRPIMQLSGNIDFSKPIPVVKDFGFDIPNPLPSEFLNLFAQQKVFRKGKFSGKLKFDNNGAFPILSGNMQAEGMRIPSQRLAITNGSLTASDGLIKLNADGRFRRMKYKFNGEILNEIRLPIVIKNISLSLDNLDIDRFLAVANNAPPNPQTQNVVPISYTNDTEIDEPDDDAQTFDISNLIIENCTLNIEKGFYKEINFSNLTANMSLDKKSLLKLHSNKFEIAEGHSSAAVECDMKNNKYKVVLGIKDVNSDIIATSLLDLKREISGKASGILALSTDKSMKLNGDIKFAIKNGSIQKIGLVEYILKFASLFRNPLAMISPSVFSDLVNIPEGNFDKISGDIHIKNNILEHIKIKSTAPQLSSYIAGRFDLDTRDASIRIYTKFSNRNKGFAGFLRNISLNSLANRVPLSTRNDANYYASELEQLPEIDADEKDCQIFLTKVEGDIEHNNFLSSLKKIK